MNAANLAHALDAARTNFMLDSIRIDRPYWEYRKIIMENVEEKFISGLLVTRDEYEQISSKYNKGGNLF